MHKSRTNLYTSLLGFSFKVLPWVHELAATQPIFAVTEHPEDLGRIWNDNHTTFQPARGEHGKPETDSGRMVVRRFPARQLWPAYTKTDLHDAKRTHLHFLH